MQDPPFNFPLFVESEGRENIVFIFRSDGREIAFNKMNIGTPPAWSMLTQEEKDYLTLNYK